MANLTPYDGQFGPVVSRTRRGPLEVRPCGPAIPARRSYVDRPLAPGVGHAAKEDAVAAVSDLGWGPALGAGGEWDRESGKAFGLAVEGAAFSLLSAGDAAALAAARKSHSGAIV